jgi:predicted RNase H-like HicB family nuclease
MKYYYYALFKQTKEAVEVEFPDLPGCVTFGKDWDEAITNASDVLAAWLANARQEIIKKPSSHKKLSKLKGTLIRIFVDEKIFQQYQELKRFNVIFPANILNKVDKFRKIHGLKRSTLLLKAAEEYLQHHND